MDHYQSNRNFVSVIKKNKALQQSIKVIAATIVMMPLRIETSKNSFRGQLLLDGQKIHIYTLLNHPRML